MFTLGWSDGVLQLLSLANATEFDSTCMKMYAFDLSSREAGWQEFHTAREDLKAQAKTARTSNPHAPHHSSPTAKVQGGWNTSSIVVGLTVLVLFLGMMVLRFHEENYDVRVDDFLHNYDVLGVPHHSEMPVVKAAWRQLSRKWSLESFLVRVSPCLRVCV
jgi:hypothetical protein